MKATLPLLAAAAVLALSGLVHGLWTDRWAASGEAEATERLGGVSQAVGDWDGEDQPISSSELALSGSTSCLARRYLNRRTGEVLTVMILSGRPGPISVHTPDVCYRGLGYEPVANPSRWTAPASTGGKPATFWTARFHREDQSRALDLRIFWSWSSEGAWEAHDNPRLASAGRKVLYKLYVVHQLANQDETLEDDPTAGFLHEFLPELERALFGGR
jgi:hypothetical protein